MKRFLAFVFVIAVFAFALLVTLKGPELYYRLKFHESRIIGRSTHEIVEKYGEFDYKGTPNPEAPGVYKDYRTYGYLVKEAGIGMFGDRDVPPVFFMIHFDEQGIAYKCEFELGGWGG